MKRIVSTLAAAALAAAFAAPAWAQDAGGLAGLFAAEMNTFGESVGHAVAGGDNVYVYAQGRARLPSAAGLAPRSTAYESLIEIKAPTAVEAARLRDAKIERLRAAAQRFGAEVQVVEESFVIEGQETPKANLLAAVLGGAHPAAGDGDAKPAAGPAPFVAKATVRFALEDAGRTPALLDAVRDAGAADLHPDPNANSFTRRMLDSFAGGAGAKADDPFWQAAMADAVRSARAQAQAFAAAAGRDLGPAQQISFLTRGADGGQAVVTVSVRFGLGPTH